MEEKPSDQKTIGKRIKELRSEKSLTQDGLARKSDIPYTTLTKIESEVIKSPTIDTVVKIATGLDIGIDVLSGTSDLNHTT